MKPELPIILCSALLLVAPQVGAQDITDGTILALDREAKVLILTDRTTWSLENLKSSLPADLKAGDRIEIKYESDEDGVSAINDIRLLPVKASAPGAPDITDGTVLVFDRKANVIVLTDRTTWSLENLKSSLPAGLKAGDRIRIQYESDEEGVSAINSIKITPK